MIERNITACKKPDNEDRESFAYGYSCCSYDAHNHAGAGFVFMILYKYIKRILTMKYKFNGELKA